MVRTWLATLPKEIGVKEYDGLHSTALLKGYTSQLQHVYQKNGRADLYEFNTSSKEEAVQTVWDLYVEINRSDWINNVTLYLVAYYISCHREHFQRKGNEVDDLHKARYLVDHVDYLNNIHPRVIRLCQGPELDEVINEVNNIFDSAYFRKLNHPELTDVECFTQAEREFCEEKEVDHLMVEYGLGNRQEAEKLYAESKIKELALKQAKWRQKTGAVGDEKSDWELAERQFHQQKAKERIAKICWIISPSKSELQDYYWTLAGEAVHILETKEIDYISESPYEQDIFEVIRYVVNRQQTDTK